MTPEQFELHWQYAGDLRPINVSPERWKGMIAWLLTRLQEQNDRS